MEDEEFMNYPSFEFTVEEEAEARKDIASLICTDGTRWMEKYRSEKEMLYRFIADKAFASQLDSSGLLKDLNLKLILAYGLLPVKTIENVLLYGMSPYVFGNLKEVKGYYGERICYPAQEILNNCIELQKQKYPQDF